MSDYVKIQISPMYLHKAQNPRACHILSVFNVRNVIICGGSDQFTVSEKFGPLAPPPSPPPPPPPQKKKKKFKPFLRLCYYILLNKMMTEVMAGWGVMALRDIISVYIEPSPRQKEKEERNNRREKELFNHPSRTYCKLAFALLLSRLVERPGTESYPSPSPDRYYPRLSL